MQRMCVKNWIRIERVGKMIGAIALTLLLGVTVSACALPQVNAEDRLFLDLSLDYLDAFEMPKQDFQDTPVGGLSAIAYDRAGDRIYALSDDRGNGSPPRFYTIQLVLDQSDTVHPRIADVRIETVTPLLDETGHRFPLGLVDPEGIALSPQQTLIISSEGTMPDDMPPSADEAGQGIGQPFISEFDRSTGKQIRSFPIPASYLLTSIDGTVTGVQDNRGFEALTLSAAGMGIGRVEPFRVFAAIEEPLRQDMPASTTNTSNTTSEQPLPGRLLHYVVGDNQATLIAEHMYPIEPKPFGAINNGLVELLSIDQAGHFLSLERSYGVMGVGAKLFQVAIANATDISQLDALNLNTIQPVYKHLELDLSELGIYLDNLEGMTLGPQLADGSQSLILVSDDNFSENQINQWLLFRIR